MGMQELRARRYKRDHPRVGVEVPVELRLADAGTIHVMSVNVSRAGLQVACDKITVASLFPQGKPTLPHTPPDVDVVLRLPGVDGGSDGIAARCHAVFARRVSENEYRVGLQFVHIAGREFERLELYIDEQSSGLYV